MKRPPVLITAAVLLTLVAGTVRFYRLGSWPFAVDELYTVLETEAWYQPHSGQDTTMPHLLPLGFAIQWLDYQLFGKDEWGSRVLMAVAGTLDVVLVFFLLDGPLPRPTAAATALLLAMWPEHIFYSQENRFYISAYLFGTLCMALGALALWSHSLRRLVFACMAAFAAILCHTVQLLLLPGLFGALLVATLASRQRRPWRLLGVAAAASVAGFALYVGYLAPLVRATASHETWAYTPVHAMLALVNQLGWPIALLAGLGALRVLYRRNEAEWYWLVWAALGFGAGGLLPLAVAYHPAYAFPLSLGILVLAGIIIGDIYTFLRRDGVPLAITWLVLVGLLNLPSLVSYFQDGSRHDFRTALQYIGRRYQPGDRIAGPAPILMAYYDPAGDLTIPIAGWDPLLKLRQLTEEPQRLWIVLPRDRVGYPEDVRLWLSRHCVHELEVRRRRFDYRDFIVDVFLYPRPAERTKKIPRGRGETVLQRGRWNKGS